MIMVQKCLSHIRIAALAQTTGLLLLLTPHTASAQDTTSTMPDHNKSTSETMTAGWINKSGAMWIWPAATGDTPNAYIQVAHELTLPDAGAQRLELAISADSNYAVWLNGAFAGFGQWSNFPDDKTYDVINLAPYAKPGANRLCISVYHQGESSSTYLTGPGGVVYAVQADGATIAASGAESRMRPAPDYTSGPMPKVTGQLGFTFEYRANKDDGWRQPDYIADASWLAPESAEMSPLSARPVRPRPIAKLKLENRAAMHIVAQGAFKRNRPDAHPAEAMQFDSLAFREEHQIFANPRPHLRDNDTTGLTLKAESWDGFNGPYFVLDTGREEAGLLELELDAPAGTILDIGYGEHLEDMRVRAHVGGRNFAVRYVCGEGHQVFLHPHLRLAGRYIQVHITPPADSAAQPLILQYAGMRPTPYPVEHAGIFESPDSLHNRIWDVSRRTLELCMHEHYEDCPWREQALYGMDARNQALAGYYCFGNYDFAAASIKLLGQGMKEDDGLLELCAPARVGITIPSFSLAWILMLDDHMLFSGNREFTKTQLPVARRLIKTFSDNTSGPIVQTPKGPRMWNFYEWAPGLDGDGIQGYKTMEEDRLEAPLNLFYLLALDATANMAKQCGQDGSEYDRLAQDLRANFAATFWDPKERVFRTRVNDGQAPHFAELTQALAILADVVPEGELDNLRKRLASDGNGLVPCTISHTLYKFEALLTDQDQYATRVFDLIERDWGYMLSQGATSFWETIDGASAFGDAGSLCHGWSGVPAWFYGAYVLGIKPTDPGFEKYNMNPVLDTFHSAKGTVPTPDGTIDVSWRNDNGNLVKDVKVKP